MGVGDLGFGALPDGVGDEGSSQSYAASVGPIAAPAPASVVAPSSPAAFDPSMIDGLMKMGKISPAQYAAMGGKLAPNADGPVAPAVAAAAAAAPVQSNGMSSSPVAPPKGGVVFHPPPGAPGASPEMQGGGISIPGLSSGVAGSPAAWVPQARHTQTEGGVAFSPETQAAEAKATAATNEVDKALEAKSAAQMNYDATKAKIDAVQSDADLASAHVQMAKQASERDWQWDKIQSAQRDIEEANAKGVDPHHWFANKSTGSKVAMAIGLMAGGFNQGIHGGENPMMSLINNEISRDIDAQKDGLAGKERNLQNRISTYGMLRQKGLDENSASDGAKLLAHQALDAQLKAAMPSVSSAMGQLQLKQAIAENQSNLVKLRGSLDEKASQRTSTSSSEAFRPAQAAVGTATPATILAHAKTLYESHYGEVGNTWEAAVRQAVRGTTGKDMMPGAAEPVLSKAVAAKPGQPGRLAKPMMAAQANMSELAELQKLSQGTFSGAQERARASQILASLKTNGVEGLPDSVGMFETSRATGSLNAAIDQAKKGQQARLQAAQSIMAGGGGAEEEPAADPEGFSEE